LGDLHEFYENPNILEKGLQKINENTIYATFYRVYHYVSGEKPE
jgi:hypothetical protein